MCCRICSRVRPCIAGIVVPHKYQFTADAQVLLEQPALLEHAPEPLAWVLLPAPASVAHQVLHALA